MQEYDSWKASKRNIIKVFIFRYWMHLAHQHDNPAHYGVRTKDYKLTFYYGLALDAEGAVDKPTQPGWELYDLQKDPSELKMCMKILLINEIREELKGLLCELKEKYQDQDEAYVELQRTFEKYK